MTPIKPEDLKGKKKLTPSEKKIVRTLETKIDRFLKKNFVENKSVKFEFPYDIECYFESFERIKEIIIEDYRNAGWEMKYKEGDDPLAGYNQNSDKYLIFSERSRK